ncbi:MAG TPA: alpha/beta fold hydrolase [Geminicoccaceae bacterium]|nr:alpha/beta fold hydrolase [Geminicoccaceae bacterium]
MNLSETLWLDFSPRRPWWGGDLQTIRNYAIDMQHALPSRAVQRVEVPLNDGSGDRLVASLHLPMRDRERPLVALIHGLAGCEASCYMTVATAFFLIRGYPVLLVNQRGAGPSRAACRGVYHAGSSDDFAALLDGLEPGLTRHGVLPVGFSLGGNMLLKFLGEAGGHRLVRRAATVSAPLDLAASCRSLMRWRNFAYHRYLLTNIKRTCTGPGAVLSEAERKAILSARNLWQFDERFTAPRHGYGGAAAFYEANSSGRFLDGIGTDTLLIHAQDDPFVPAAAYLARDWARQPRLTALLPQGGGHLGFHDPLGLWHLRQIHLFFSQS